MSAHAELRPVATIPKLEIPRGSTKPDGRKYRGLEACQVARRR